MSTLIITRGLPGSGKTTWAEQWVAEDPKNRARVNRDDLRYMHYRQYEGLTFEQENLVTKASQALCKLHLDAGRDVVADDMNLRLPYVRTWEKFARANGANFEIMKFEISIDESVLRNLYREVRGERFVNAKAIRGMGGRYLAKGEKLQPYERLREEPKIAIEPYVADLSNPDAFIVDLDGTMALNTSGRDWYDLSRVHEDSLCAAVSYVVDAIAFNQHADVIFLSGREETAEESTRTWLEEKAGWREEAYELYMRPEGDDRPDYIVKRELFDAHIRHRFNVIGVFDDRPSVARMWRELGLFTFQVGDPHVEF